MSHEKKRGEETPQPPKAATIEILRALEEWQSAWTKAVALVWSDPEKYEKSLKEDPRGFLAQHCHYHLHQNVTVEVKGSANDESAETGADDPDALPLPSAHLTMWLPRRPSNIQDAPLALVEYMRGRSYPCFCC